MRKCEGCGLKRKEQVFERFYHEICGTEDLRFRGIPETERSKMVRKVVEDVKECLERCFIHYR